MKVEQAAEQNKPNLELTPGTALPGLIGRDREWQSVLQTVQRPFFYDNPLSD